MVRARLRVGGTDNEACILDISTRGLSATSASAPQRGEIVELVVGRHNIVGQVKWAGDRRFGVAFRERVSVIAAISGQGNLALPSGRQAARAAAIPNAAAAEAAVIRKVEFVLFATAAAVAVLTIGSYATTALASLDTARVAMVSPKVNG